MDGRKLMNDDEILTLCDVIRQTSTEMSEMIRHRGHKRIKGIKEEMNPSATL